MRHTTDPNESADRERKTSQQRPQRQEEHDAAKQQQQGDHQRTGYYCHTSVRTDSAQASGFGLDSGTEVMARRRSTARAFSR